MDYTEKHVTRVRKYVNDKDASLFDDEEIEDVLTEAADVYAAASLLWTMKAGFLEGEIESFSVGQERYDLASLKDRMNHALQMADYYSSLSKEGGAEGEGGVSSYMLGVKRPNVLGEDNEKHQTDASRLYGF